MSYKFYAGHCLIKVKVYAFESIPHTPQYKLSDPLLGTRQQINNLDLHVKIENTSLETCNNSKLLGVVIDNCLSWNDHIEYLYKKISPKLGILYRLSKFLSKPILNTIYLTLIQPDFDYCISLWGNCSSGSINKIQKLQNRAARIVSNEYNWNISSSELIEQLKWMNIKTRRDYFISLIMFKTVNGFGLNYLLNVLTVTQDYHNYNTRASSNNFIVLPRPHCELFKTSMKYYACDLWNSLPGHIKSAENIQTFKSMYKRYIYTQNE